MTKAQRNKGASLIEVLIAMLILALIVGPFLTMFVQAAKANAESRVMMDATYYGQALMESVKYSVGQNGMTDARNFLKGQGYVEQVYTADVHYDYTLTDSHFTYVVDLDNTDMTVPFFKITVKVYTDAGKTDCKANIQVLCQ